jgi:hypothetical protein
MSVSQPVRYVIVSMKVTLCHANPAYTRAKEKEGLCEE